MMHDIAYSSSALGRMYSGGGVTNIHNNNGAIKLDKTNNPRQKLWSSSIAEGQYYSSHPHTQPLMPQSIAIDSLISLTRFTVIHDSICLKISSIKCHQYSDFVIICKLWLEFSLYSWLYWEGCLQHIGVEATMAAISKYIFLCENCCVLIQTSLKFVSTGPINNKPALDQIIAWCRTDDKPLSEPMLAWFTDAYMRHSACRS